MGWLLGPAGALPLLPESLVGRDPSTWLCLDDPTVSQFHAVLTWRQDGWYAKDLASRNGTRVDGGPLRSHEQVRLALGTELRFGAMQASFRLEDAGPPRALAQTEDRGSQVVGTPHALELPGPDTPRLLLYADPARGWQLQTVEGEPGPAPDQVELDGVGWRIFLPGPSEQTPFAAEGAAPDVRLFLERTEQAWVLLATQGGEPRRRDLGWEGKLLRHLAEARQHGDGWVDLGRLADQMQVSRRSVNVATQRLRRALDELGVPEPARVVEVRPNQRRLGPISVRLADVTE